MRNVRLCVGLLAWAALAFAQGTEYPAVKYPQ